MTTHHARGGTVGVVMLLILVAAAGFYIWTKYEQARHPSKVARAGVWRLTTFQPIYERGVQVGSNFTSVFYRFGSESIRLYHYTGQTNENGFAAHDRMRKSGESSESISAIAEFPDETPPRFVIRTEKSEWSLYFEKDRKRFVLSINGVFIGHIYKDEIYSAYPTRL